MGIVLIAYPWTLEGQEEEEFTFCTFLLYLLVRFSLGEAIEDDANYFPWLR